MLCNNGRQSGKSYAQLGLYMLEAVSQLSDDMLFRNATYD